ncbi:SDR family NAD(P)-dependent oxidoreductase [Streptomyces axinellae]|uniref:SDR family NAD(P)-dependent oxidoreductase n=1 Tax=Streptomyces axinellae TaxID=552788 RepID=A0ABP6CFU1_9ACTN
MNPKQHPLGSGFTAASTAADVLEGIDLSGINVVITGGHVGLGLQTTRTLSAAGASVTVGSRHRDRAARALTGTARVEVGQLDLLDPASIDAFTARYLDSGRPLHILINNAGIMGGPLVRDTRGYESQFATNHLGHFQPTLELLPALRAAQGARVVNVSSGGHRLSGIRWEDPHFTTGYDPMLAYGQSKTANILFAVELDRRGAGEDIRGSVHSAMGLTDASGRPIIDPDRDKKTPQQGAGTIVFTATSPLLAGIGGVYLRNNDISPLDDSAGPAVFDAAAIASANVVPHAIDPDAARRLWELSERLLKG